MHPRIDYETLPNMKTRMCDLNYLNACMHKSTQMQLLDGFTVHKKLHEKQFTKPSALSEHLDSPAQRMGNSVLRSSKRASYIKIKPKQNFIL